MEDFRLLFIGQAPSRETDGQPPFVGRCGKFLAALMGLTQEEMLAQHDFVNVLDRWPGKGINGDKFPISEAKPRAAALVPMMANRFVILLGSNVVRAFGIPKFKYYDWHTVQDSKNSNIIITRKCSILPHPSGVNRIWNNPDEVLKAKKFFQLILGEGK